MKKEIFKKKINANEKYEQQRKVINVPQTHRSGSFDMTHDERTNTNFSRGDEHAVPLNLGHIIGSPIIDNNIAYATNATNSLDVNARSA
jgi:hypothetical protein